MHNIADASQKFTWPVVSTVGPALTVAVSVTMEPDVADVTTLPPEVTVSVVDVAGILAAACSVAISDPRIRSEDQRRKDSSGKLRIIGPSTRDPPALRV